jgi:hypothetical protein
MNGFYIGEINYKMNNRKKPFQKNANISQMMMMMKILPRIQVNILTEKEKNPTSVDILSSSIRYFID